MTSPMNAAPAHHTERRRADNVLRSLANQHPDKPISAMIEIADRCNEVCVHCYQVQGQKGEMSTEDICKILDDLAQMGVLKLNISGGEATLRQDLLEILGYARGLGFLISLYTNGMTMTVELANALAELGLHAVEISLYSRLAETHDFVTGVPGSFEKTVAGIRNLRAAGVFVVVKNSMMSINEGELDAYRSFVEDDLGATSTVSLGGLHVREDGDRDLLALNPASDLAQREQPKLPSEPVPVRDPRSAATRPCRAGAAVHVEPNGEMRPCTQLRVDLGDARTASLKDRNETVAVRQLTGLNWGDLHGCRDCALSGYCTHCYADALAQVGDALSPYPPACTSGRRQYGFERRLAPELIEGVSELGPYAIGPGGRLVAMEHIVTAADDALAEAMPWVRAANFVAQPPPASAQPGELVQLRRPGRKRGTEHRIPDALGAAGGGLDQGRR